MNLPNSARQYNWLSSGNSHLFSCLHRPGVGASSDTGVVVCYPLGHEYTHSYSTMVSMADQFAAAGLPCLRFDYHGTGDSSGDLRDPDRIGTWIGNIEAAVRHLKKTTGVDKVCLIGLRMGATMAALYSAKADVDFLILWNTCIRGDAFVRDMQIMDQYHGETNDKNEFFEFGGFVTTGETLESYKSINLNKVDFGAKANNLIIHKSDVPASSRLVNALTERLLAAEEITLEGYAEMMRQPQFSKVADTVIDHCVDWLKKQAVELSASSAVPPPVEEAVNPLSNRSVEIIAKFGRANRLFGILNKPTDNGKESAGRDRVFVISNTGAAHHVGPNRLHVELCRKLAQEGLASFRFDLANIGDSAAGRVPGLNHPYPAHAVEDLAAAISYLETEHGYRVFILGGLCSGANTAFHASLQLSAAKVSKAILINPLIFYWEDGLSLATPQRQQQQVEKKYYAQSARSLDKWLKLIKGQINIKALSGFLLKQAYLLIATPVSNWLEKLGIKPPARLGADLIQLEAMKRPLDLVLSETDPGYEIFLAEGRETAKQKIKSGFVTTQFIPDADHTFTTLSGRNALIATVMELSTANTNPA